MCSKTSATFFLLILLLGLPIFVGYSTLPSNISPNSLSHFVGEITEFWSKTLERSWESLLPIVSPTSTPTSNKRVEVYETGSLGLWVRNSHSLSARMLGKVFDGTQFTIVSGPQSGDDYEWFNVRLEGWCAANWLSGELGVDESVRIIDTGDLGLRVRNKAGLGGDVLGKVYDGAILLTLEGPISSDGFQWWKVRLEGWSASKYLREPVPSAEDFVRPTGSEDEQPSAEDLQRRIEGLRKVLTMDTLAISLPSEGFTLQRWLVPNIIERSDEFYFFSLDYNILAAKTLLFAEDLLETGEIELASEYIERACGYIKLSDMLEDGSIEQLMASVDISQDLVIAMAAKTALQFTIGSIAPGFPGQLALNMFTTYVDYSIATGVREVPIGIAAREQLTEFVVKGIFMIPAVNDAIGEPVTEFVGKESGLYQRLERLIATPEVREEIIKSIARGAESLLIESAEYDATFIANHVVDKIVELVTDK